MSKPEYETLRLGPIVDGKVLVAILSGYHRLGFTTKICRRSDNDEEAYIEVVAWRNPKEDE